MTDKHTPILTAIGDRIYGETPEDGLIARVYGDDALAAQFAAAPELKAACEGLLQHFVAEYGEGAPQCVDDALAVLAKLKD